MTSRRSFLKTGGAVCVAACGSGFLLSVLQSCKPSQVLHVTINKNEISIPLQSFADKKVVVVRNNNLEDDIAVIKNSDTVFTAILMQCTHQQNSVTLNGNGFYCPLHGSTFDMNGKVLKEPAVLPLKKYHTELRGGEVIIKLDS